MQSLIQLSALVKHMNLQKIFMIKFKIDIPLENYSVNKIKE